MRELIEKIIESKLSVVIDKAKVVELSGSTCKVESLSTKKTHFKCSLNAVLSETDNKLKVTPKVGSTVVIGISNEDVFIIATSEVDTIEFKQGTVEMLINKDGFKIERDGENFFQCISDMIDELNKIIVINGTSINVSAMQAIKQRFSKITI